ncbi:MAG TPA: WecB/TagA/CpsF family glycosyltransferase, partial [Actinomycetota bacterium]|nr:WecB/TagA/CpsF family glycosyltransferase [Actinomycetota bacterium]
MRAEAPSRQPRSRWRIRQAVALGWTGVDQLLSSISNVVVSLAVARAAGVAGLGAYTVAFALSLVVLGFQRALITEPLLAIPVSEEPDVNPRRGLGAVTLLAAGSAMALVVAGLLSGRSELIALAAVIGFVCLQDAYRYVLFRRRKAHLAAVIDTVWVIASIAGWPLITSRGTPTTAVVIWGIGAGLSALLGAWISGLLPGPGRGAIRWWSREARPLGGFLAVESMFYAVGGQITVLGLAVALGKSALGEWRAAQIMFGSIALVMTAISFFALPRLAAVRERLSLRVAGLVAIASTGLVAICVTLLFLAAPLLFPILYGTGLEPRPALLVPMALQMVVGALAMGPILLLKARMTGKPLAGTRIITTLVGVPLILVVASSQGLVPAVWAMLGQAALHVCLVWRAAARSLRLVGTSPESYAVLGVRIDPLGVEQAAEALDGGHANGRARIVHQCNAYNLLLASKDPAYRTVMNRGDLNLPDGWPAVWAGRRLGVPVGERVAGADLCDAVFRRGIQTGLRHFFYGGTEASLERLVEHLRRSYPGIEIAGVYAPPFRPLTRSERGRITALVNGARPDVVWVGLGTPKQ